MTIQFRLPDMLKTTRSWHRFTQIPAATEESHASDAICEKWFSLPGYDNCW
jgi:hypothetical protein